jgi:hypothetical protein
MQEVMLGQWQVAHLVCLLATGITRKRVSRDSPATTGCMSASLSRGGPGASPAPMHHK